ncbi:pria protein [Moniliophthora roreri MCA 2997]|uniref:Pria protein n=1 Tax=Moniliophthora roreri (strain MCA 2997) TaxID=1381753 RepID=V2X515_MONRO|nr:pria protein [Moniliophthora roreri MCA 2997]
MPVFTQIFTLAAAATIAILPLATAFQTSASSCQENEFWYETKGICLPYGVTNTTAPPPNRDCPPAGFYWDKNLGCCVPTYPISTGPSNPPPQCRVGWEWYPALHVCLPYTPDLPSSVPSGAHYRRKRGLRTQKVPLCPKGLQACPIPGASHKDYECLNLMDELESCGGCASTGEGRDCTTIKGAWNVGCEQGRCAVYTCFAGYKRSADGGSCIPI